MFVKACRRLALNLCRATLGENVEQRWRQEAVFMSSRISFHVRHIQHHPMRHETAHLTCLAYDGA